MESIREGRITIRLTPELCSKLEESPKGTRSKIVKEALYRYFEEKPIVNKTQEKEREIKELEEEIARLQSKDFDKNFLRWLDVEGFGFQWKHLNHFQKNLVRELLDQKVPLKEAMFMIEWSYPVDKEKKSFVWRKVRTLDAGNIELMLIAERLTQEFRYGRRSSGDEVL